MAEKTAQRLEKIGIHTLFDLLLHLPTRYQDKTRCTPLNQLNREQEHLVFGRIVDIQSHRRGRSQSAQIQFSDDTEEIGVIHLFHCRAAQIKTLQQATYISAYGKAEAGYHGWKLLHPLYQLHHDKVSFSPEKTLTPVYALCQGLQQKRLRTLINQNIALLEKNIKEYDTSILSDIQALPELIKLPTNLGFPAITLAEALAFLHSPNPCLLDQFSLKAFRQRIAFEELVAHQLGLRQCRLQTKKAQGLIFNENGEFATALLKSLSFTLTSAQTRVIQEVIEDFSSQMPMLRMIQGDVGCGKTIVAAMVAVHGIEQGWQCALMAPTELLAMQHLACFQQWLEPMGIVVMGLTSKSKQKKQRLARIESGEVNLLIGTQALIQEQVKFANLGLCIIDEQHRFGVRQRLQLKNKGQNTPPHQLIMTATPIPRSLAMTFYADLDISIIDEQPAFKQPIQTVVLPDTKRDAVIQRLKQLCQQGQQAYWVCPLIEECEDAADSPLQSAEQMIIYLQEKLPETNAMLIHGRMRPEDKLSIMEAFKQKKHWLLVSTTVIEVGIDIPNATLMVIENANHLGLAQLHQLRGRVGRGKEKSYCILMYGAPLGAQGKARLGMIRASNNGFDIAQKDLEMRGPGEFLGLKQSGKMNFRAADLAMDSPLLPFAQQTADQLLNEPPEKAKALMQRWLGKVSDYKNA